MSLNNAACEVVCPTSTSVAQLRHIHPSSLELLRGALSFLVTSAHCKEALELAARMADIFRACEAENSMCKALLSVTILQLHLGDYVKVTASTPVDINRVRRFILLRHRHSRLSCKTI